MPSWPASPGAFDVQSVTLNKELIMKKLEWKWMIPCMITISISVILLLVGCDEFWQKGDEIVRDVNDIAGGARAVLDSPAGQMIPPGIKLYGVLGLAAVNALVIGWEELRNRTMKKTTKAIVDGIENTSNPDKAVSEVKSNIANEMRRQGGDKFYAKANKIVDKLKIS